MSLINQVLKDLEKRHANADAGGVTRAVRALPEGRARRGLWIVLGVTSIAAAGAAAWWLTRHESPLPIIAGKPAAPAPVPVPQVKPPETPMASPAPGPQASVAPSSPATLPSMPAGVANPSPIPAGAATLDVNQRSAPLNAPPVHDAPVAHAPNAAASPAPRPAANKTSAAHDQPIATAAVATEASDPEAASVKPKPVPSKLQARAAPLPKPKVSASVQSVQYPDAEESGNAPAANIDKQVRQPSNRDRAEASFRLGMAAIQNGAIAEGEVALHEALRLDPMLDKARQALLGLYVEAGRREEAERLLEQRLQLDNNHAAFAMALARLQLEHASNADAVATLQRSAAQGANSADYQAMYANALSRTGRHKEAAERFAEAARLAPRNPLWALGLGVELRSENRNAEARAAFQRARELGGLNAQLTSYLDQQLRELQ
jgi:MSHA biogenesis protein MshN